MALADVLDRVDILLQDLDPSLVRRLTTPLRKLASHDETPTDWHPLTLPLSFGYLLTEGGGGDRLRAPIIGRQPRQGSIAIDLVTVNAGPMAHVTRQDVERAAAEQWEDIVSVLVDPNGHDRATTGWWAAFDFQAQPLDNVGDRYLKRCRFGVIYAYQNKGL